MTSSATPFDGWDVFAEDDGSYTYVGPHGERGLGFHTRKEAVAAIADLLDPDTGREDRIAQANTRNRIYAMWRKDADLSDPNQPATAV